jgi:hypothetical protein
MERQIAHPAVRRPIHYDAVRRRLWIRGQRLHHGATGAFLTALGVALMAHDWKDRPLWFERGWQSQP